MTNSPATVNTTISGIVSSKSLPAFVRDDNPIFVSFMEAYFEYLEKTSPASDTGSTGTGSILERLKNLRMYQTDLDNTLSDFSNLLYSQFTQFIPQQNTSRIDFTKVLPHIKDFYRARGTEKSYKFLLRLLTNGQESSVYYPKDNILRASDGKWFVQKSLRVDSTQLDGNLDSSLQTFGLFVNRVVTGSSSNTTATVERVEQFYELGTLVNEIFLSGISNTFVSGETVTTNYTDSSNTAHTLRSNIFSGLVTTITVGTPGEGYLVGDDVPLIALDSGSGATAYVSEVSEGNVSSVSVLNGGSGYRADAPGGGDWLLITGGFGTGANGNVLTVNTSGTFHPNSYIIDANTIVQIGGANWNAAQAIFSITTSNLALNAINSLATTFTFANTGPVTGIRMNEPGSGYLAVPTISVIPNTVIATLGILGSLIIANAGTGYVVGETLSFTNPMGSFGFGAVANIVSVAGNGAITGVRYQDNPGILKGGSGYDQSALPTVTINTSAGVNGNVYVASLLGYGANLTPTTGTIGSILEITVSTGGSGYTVAPTVDLTNAGDGTATAEAAVIQGVFTYPGYFLNQDGFPSAFNFLQDRDYYQNYSYVLRVASTFESWIASVNNLLHPSGMKVFGEYLILDDTQVSTANGFGIGYEAAEKTESYYVANTAFFDGAGYLWTNSINWAGSDSGQTVFSVWFTLSNYLPNTTAKATLFSAGPSNIAMPKFEVHIANSANADSGTGHYLRIIAANTANIITLDVKTDEIRNPLITNVWYHAIFSADFKTQVAGIFLNNVNSAIITTMSANTGEKFKYGTQMSFTTVGANTSGGNTFTGNIADLWTTPFSFFKDIRNWTDRSGWLSGNLTPQGIGLLPNGYGWGGNSTPILYLRANNVPAGNNNSGNGMAAPFRVPTGNVTVSLSSGPGYL